MAVARPGSSTGGDYWAYRVLRSLAERGFEVNLVIPYGGLCVIDNAVIKDLVSRGVVLAGYSYVRFGLDRTFVNMLVPLVSNAIVGLRYWGSVKADAVVSFHEIFEALYTAQRLAAELGAKSVGFLQLPISLSKEREERIRRALDLWYRYLYSPIEVVLIKMRTNLLNKLNSWRIRGIAMEFDNLVGVSKAICVEMEGFPKPVQCMDRGVAFDEEYLKLIERVSTIYREKRSFIVFGGRPAADKGVVEGLLIFREISKVFPDLKLFITGRIRVKILNRLRKIAKRLGIGDRVVFTGLVSRDERLRIVREAKLMLYPSHMDAFPYAVSEALYLGTPVVAYDIPATRIHYSGLEGVKLVPEGDIEAMTVEAMDMLSRGRADVEKPRLRSWSEIVDDIEAILKKFSS